MQTRFLHEWLRRANRAAEAGHTILAIHEDSESRIIILEKTLAKLRDLPVDVRDYFEEATSCLSYRLYRAAIVFSWAGFFYVLAERLYADKEEELRRIRSKWAFADLAELQEAVPESQILKVCRDLKMISRSDHRLYDGQLSLRNKCAHPTLFKPTLNGALGYVDSMIDQSKQYI